MGQEVIDWINMAKEGTNQQVFVNMEMKSGIPTIQDISGLAELLKKGSDSQHQITLFNITKNTIQNLLAVNFVVAAIILNTATV